MSLMDQDEALVSAALGGSARDWDLLVRHYELRVYNFCLRLTGNQADACDLMQEVFIGVYRNLHRFRGDSQFSTWLFRIAYNKAVDMSRRRPDMSVLQAQKDVAAGVQEQGFYDDIDDDPLTLVDQAQRNRQLAACLGALSWDQRMLVELKVYQSHTFEEIAQMQGISANTAKTRFYAALKKLKSLMEHDHDL